MITDMRQPESRRKNNRKENKKKSKTRNEGISK